MSDPSPVPTRERTRAQLIEVAAGLLAAGGPDAVTTRAVALAAGVQAPTLYRLFGDKDGLLAAVAEEGFASYVAGKRLDEARDPVAGLREGWDLHVGFGLANPELFRLMHLALRTPRAREIVAAGTRVLEARVHLVAAAGRLRVTERRAVDLIAAAGTGVVLQLVDLPAESRDTGLADLAWEAVCAAVLTDAPQAVDGPQAAAVALRAALPDLGALSPAERALMADWLDRVAEG